MGYLVCGSCGGFYELEDGESADDFDVCQCGGNLKFKDKLTEVKTDESETSIPLPENNNVLICPHCFKHHDSGIFCSRCGSDLISVEKGNGLFNMSTTYKKANLKLENRLKSRYDEMIPSRAYPGTPRRIPKKLPPTDSREDQEQEPSDIKKIISRISWIGVVVGSVFYIISFIIVLVLIIFFVASQIDFSNINTYYDYSGLKLFSTILILLMFIVISIISGALAAYISKSRDYLDGLLNGFIVGLAAIAVLMGSGSSLAFIIVIILASVMSSMGGLLGIFVRKNFFE